MGGEGRGDVYEFNFSIILCGVGGCLLYLKCNSFINSRLFVFGRY